MRRQRVAVAFGKVLKDLRMQVGMTQEELAVEAEFDRTYPSLLERGLRTPTLSVIISLAKVLKTTAPALVNKTLEEMARR